MVSRKSFQPLQRIFNHTARLSLLDEPRVIAGGLLVFTAIFLLMLISPGRTYVGQYAHDILIFLDGGHRILHGQVPNRDFHTPLGPLAFLFPALGLSLGGSLGAMMPFGTAAFMLIYAPLLIYVSSTRLRMGWGLGFGLFMALLVITPLNPGESQDRVSFAMFYNRFGWALLGTLFLMVLPPKSKENHQWLDAIVITTLLLLMFYLKISYAFFGFCFVVGTLLLGPRRTATLSLALTIIGILLVELFWRGTREYISDIEAAAAASGALRGSVFTLGRTVLDNLTASILFASLLFVGWLRGVQWIYFVFAIFMSAAGLLIINQNAQVTEIVTLVPAGLIMLLAPVRSQVQPDYSQSRFAGTLLIIALAAPLAIVNLMTLVYHTVKAVRPPSQNPFEARVDGLITLEGEYTPSAKALPEIYRRGGADVETINMLRHARYRQALGQTEYLRTVEDALNLLHNRTELKGRIFVLDMVNPLNALAKRPPPTGVDAWYHAGRTFNERNHRSADILFKHVDVVMVPKNPVEFTSSRLLDKLYGSYVGANYELKVESTYWWGYGRKAQN